MLNCERQRLRFEDYALLSAATNFLEQLEVPAWLHEPLALQGPFNGMDDDALLGACINVGFDENNEGKLSGARFEKGTMRFLGLRLRKGWVTTLYEDGHLIEQPTFHGGPLAPLIVASLRKLPAISGESPENWSTALQAELATVLRRLR